MITGGIVAVVVPLTLFLGCRIARQLQYTHTAQKLFRADDFHVQ